MRILVIGSGGREHALCWAIAASPLCERLYCAPGNAGIAAEAECVDIAAEDVDRLVAYAVEQSIDLVIVGPEVPLVAGLVDRLRKRRIKAFGPTAAAARLEGSKAFMKDICASASIPTAVHARFTDAAAAASWIREQGAPLVVKADGLAAGKGVTIAATVDEAIAASTAALQGGVFGSAGSTIVIEQFLEGEELSFFALVDGATALPLAGAQDHKTAYDGDKGPNTGGMGAYSPTPALTPALQETIMERIIDPTVAAMAAAGQPYQGALYAGLMLTESGPQLIEYNVRFGDPECQVLIPRLKSDLLPALIATCDGQLRSFDLRWRDEAALTVVLAAEGYPGSYEKGSEIRGLEQLSDRDDLVVFHAGTRGVDGRILANGGRVLNVTARAPTVTEAQAKAYAAVDQIDWPEGFCRRDIGWRAVATDRG